MADDFDPYYQWLGIPPKYRPPSHYRLLAIEEFESNGDVIENAADRQVAHVRLYQNGPQGDVSQKLLNEITAAKLCLLNPQKKAAYDQQLRTAKQASEPPAAPPAPRSARAVPLAPADPSQPFDEGNDVVSSGAAPSSRDELSTLASAATGSVRTTPTLKRRPSGLPPLALAGAAGGLVVLAIVAFLMFRRPPGNDTQVSQSGKTAAHANPPTSKTTEPAKKSSLENPAKTSMEPPPETAKTKTTDEPPPTKESPSKPAPKKKPDPSVLPREGVSVDLLQVIDLARDRGAGEWNFDKMQLQGDANDDFALLKIPQNCPREYDLTVVARRTGADGALAIGLLFGQHRVALLCDNEADGKKSTLLHAVKDFAVGKTSHEGAVFAGSEAVTLLIQVRHVGIAVIADDQPLFAWRGNGADLSLAPLWAKRSPGEGLFLGLQNAKFQFDKLELRRVTSGAPVVTAKRRPPVPPAAELDSARRQVRESFDGEIKAARTPPDKLALVAKLLQQASREDEAAAKYALLDVALELAMQAGDAPQVAKVVEQQTAAFEVEGAARLLESLSQLSAEKLSPEKRKSLIEAVLDASERFANEENFKAAADCLAFSAKMAPNIGDADLRRRATSVRERIEQTKAWWDDAEAARKVLADKPEDPAANRSLGKYLCFAKEDWENGLPHLSQGDEAKLKAAAALELASPDTPAKQQAAGDVWWDLAAAAAGHAKLALQKRAHYWYEQAVEGLRDSAKSTVEKRIATLEKALGDSSGDASSAAVLAKRIVGDFFLTAAGKKGKTTATLAFAADGAFSDSQLPVGKWTIESGQVRIKYDDEAQGSVQLRARGPGALAGQQTLGSGDVVAWQLRQVVALSTWEVFDERLPRDLSAQQLVLYSNGKANDIYGGNTWSLAGNNLTLDWKDFRRLGTKAKGAGGTGLQGTFLIQSGGKLFRGSDSRGRPYRGERVANPKS